MHPWIGSALVGAIAWRRFIVNSKNNEQASVKFDIRYQYFLSENYIWKYCLKKCSLFWPKCFTKNSPCEGVTHWDRVTHICISTTTITGSDNGLLPGWCQAIIWTNAGILWTGTLGTNFSEISIKYHSFSFKKCIWKCCLANGSHLV